jgi:voltage-gated potassium channel
MISFMGIIDLLSSIPVLFALIYSPLATLVLLRVLKISRIFRLFKLIGVFKAYSELLLNVERNMLKMVVFIIGFWSVCIVLGGFMYLLEEDNAGFDNMFKAVYWAVVTLTTVGYGDSVPDSTAGQVLATITMTLGYTFVVLGLRHQLTAPGTSRTSGVHNGITDGSDDIGTTLILCLKYFIRVIYVYSILNL